MTALNPIVDRLVAALTEVCGALLESSASSRPVASVEADGFVVSAEASQGQRGRLTVFFGRPGAEAFAQAQAHAAAVPTDAAIVECLKDVAGQALAALRRTEVGCTFTVVAVEAGGGPEGASREVEIVIDGHGQPLIVAIAGQLEDTTHPGGAPAGRTLDVLMDIDLPLVVRFGRTDLPLKTLTEMGPGSVIDLGRSPDEPVDLLISNRVVARGDVVIVAGQYGVRVRDVVSPAERARSLEAEPV